MRSRSTLEWAGIALGAVTQGVWLGVLASALSARGGRRWRRSPPRSCWRLRPRRGGPRRTRAACAAAVRSWPLVLVAAAVLFAAGRGWEHEFFVWQVVRYALFVAAAALLGVRLGRGDDGPDEAFGAVRPRVRRRLRPARRSPGSRTRRSTGRPRPSRRRWWPAGCTSPFSGTGR